MLGIYWSKILGKQPGEVMEAKQVGIRGAEMDVVWDKEKGRILLRGAAAVASLGQIAAGR